MRVVYGGDYHQLHDSPVRRSLRWKIVDHLHEHPDFLAPLETAAALGADRETLSQILYALLPEGTPGSEILLNVKV